MLTILGAHNASGYVQASMSTSCAEPEHAAAITFFDAATGRITHSYVLAEFIALTQARRFPRAGALAFVADLQDSPEVTVIYVDEPLHRAALSLL